MDSRILVGNDSFEMTSIKLRITIKIVLISLILLGCFAFLLLVESKKIDQSNPTLVTVPALNISSSSTTAPSKTILQALLKSGNYSLKELFNRSGELYREMKMAEKLPSMSEDKAIELLAFHGKLVKRPVITDGRRHTVGFNPEAMKRIWG